MKAIYVLHNHVKTRDSNNYEDTLFTTLLSNLTGATTWRTLRIAGDVRAKFMNYFTNEESVEWQNYLIQMYILKLFLITIVNR